MAVTHIAPGKIKAIIYFVNNRGTVMMLPTDEESFRFRKKMSDMGFEMMFAESLSEARKLQKTMQEQMYNEQQKELELDERATRMGRQRVRDRLYARMNSATCLPTERDFIRGWLAWREHKHDIFKKRFVDQVGHLDALEFDNPDKHIHELLDRV